MIKDGLVRNTETKILVIRGKPTVEVTPVTATVEEHSDYVISCRVSDTFKSGQSPPEIIWKKGDEILHDTTDGMLFSANLFRFIALKILINGHCSTVLK